MTSTPGSYNLSLPIHKDCLPSARKLCVLLSTAERSRWWWSRESRGALRRRCDAPSRRRTGKRCCWSVSGCMRGGPKIFRRSWNGQRKILLSHLLLNLVQAAAKRQWDSAKILLSAAEGQRLSNYSSCCSWIFHLIYALSTSTTMLPPIFLNLLNLSIHQSIWQYFFLSIYQSTSSIR